MEKKLLFANLSREAGITNEQIDLVENPVVKKILTDVIYEGGCRTSREFGFGEGFGET